MFLNLKYETPLVKGVILIGYPYLNFLSAMNNLGMIIFGMVRNWLLLLMSLSYLIYDLCDLFNTDMQDCFNAKNFINTIGYVFWFKHESLLRQSIQF